MPTVTTYGSSCVSAGTVLRAEGDEAGLAGTTSISNATVAAGGSTATMANAPAAGNPIVWMKVYVGATAYVVPCFAIT